MDIVFPEISFWLAAPEIGLAILIGIVLIADLFTPLENKAAIGILSFIGVVLLAFLSLSQWGGGAQTTFSGFYVVDNFSVFVKVVILTATALSISLSLQYLKVEKINYGEFYGLLLFSAFGMLVMASGNDLISIYLGIETMSLSIYVLVGFIRHDPLSREASLKYFLMGAFASGIVLYGMALTYGLTGTTSLIGISESLSGAGGEEISSNPVMIFALILLVAGFAFKLALVPFHMWLPDAYTGAPTTITAFMSVTVKAAASAALIRLFFIGLQVLAPRWNFLLWLLAAFTMIWGNVAAIAQTSLKRILAYSSIAHVGYLLLGVVAAMTINDGKVVFSDEGISAVLFYLVVYMFTNLGAFGMLILICREGYRGDNIEDWRGVGQAHPIVGLSFVVFLLSLAGIPPTAGFVGKLILFAAAIQNQYYWLAVIGIFSSAVSIYYYGHIIRVLYMSPRDTSQPPIEFSKSPSLLLTLFLLVIATIALGIFPGSFIEAARGSVLGI